MPCNHGGGGGRLEHPPFHGDPSLPLPPRAPPSPGSKSHCPDLHSNLRSSLLQELCRLSKHPLTTIVSLLLELSYIAAIQAVRFCFWLLSAPLVRFISLIESKCTRFLGGVIFLRLNWLFSL